MERTEMLIIAMEKIKAFNRLYQGNQYKENPELGKMISEFQDRELIKIERSCAEHAIISLVTAFEVYYKELLQEIIYSYPDIFLSKTTKYSKGLNQILIKQEVSKIEDIERYLKLRNRFDYFDMFEAYSIEFLSDEYTDFFKYIYTKRNCFVHSAGKIDSKTSIQLKKIPNPIKHKYTGLTTEPKRLRTKINKIVRKIDDRIKKRCKDLSEKK